MSRTSKLTRIPADAHVSAAAMHEELDERTTLLRNKLDYAAKFAAEGESYSELVAGEIKVHPGKPDTDSTSAGR